jgi:hypothetical protein
VNVAIGSLVRRVSTWHAVVIRLQPGGGVRLNDVLRERPAKHRADSLPTLFSFSREPLIDDGLQQLPNVTSANFRRVSLKEWRERAPQAALDLSCGPQTTDNAPPKIEIDQLLGCNSRCGRVPRLALLGDQVAPLPRRAGQFVGPVARLFQADVGGAPERQVPHLAGSPNAVRQVPRLDAAGRDPDRQSFAPLIRHPIRRLRRPQCLNRAVRERLRAASQSRPKSHSLSPLLFALSQRRRNKIGGSRRTDANTEGW